MAKAKTENMQPPAFLQRLLDGVKDIEDKEVSVNVKSKKFKPEQSFVMVFTGVALQLFEKLTFNDFKVTGIKSQYRNKTYLTSLVLHVPTLLDRLKN